MEATDGVTQALAVAPVEGEPDKYTVVDGERRFWALKALGFEKVPALVLQSSKAKLAAVASNLQRVDLNAIETAIGIEVLAAVEGLRTNKQIAERIGKSAAYVGEHLRLLKLPQSVQAHIAAGYVPVEAERNLRKAAKVSPALADCASQLVKEKVIEGRDLIERFGQVVMAVADSELADRPTMIDAIHGEALGQIVSDHDLHAALLERYERVVGHHEAGTDPVVRFSSNEVEAARAAGCLIEFAVEDRWGSEFTATYITDADLAADLAARVIERYEKRASEAVEAVAELAPDAEAGGEEAAQTKEAEREERRKARRAAEAAHEKNTAIGRALIGRRGAKNRKENKLAWAKAVAAVILGDNENLAAAGLGLAFEQLQSVEHKQIKSTGEAQKKGTYSKPESCNTYLSERIEEARSAEQVWELLAEALIAAVSVDVSAVPRSRRVDYWLRFEDEVAKILAAQIKAVRPRRRGKGRR